MEAATLIDLDKILERFGRLVDERIRLVDELTSIDVHLDELGINANPLGSQVDTSLTLLKAIVSRPNRRFRERIVMLLVPLRPAPALDRSTPRWNRLVEDLSQTPPSIYVMGAAAYVQPDSSEKFISRMSVPEFEDRFVAGYYHCWRNLSDPSEDGWARDVRVVYTGFLGA